MPPIYHCSIEYINKFNNTSVHPHIPDGNFYAEGLIPSVVYKEELKMTTVSLEVKEIFDEPEFAKKLKVLASEFGSNTTLESLFFWYQQNKEMPTKTISGKVYKAGYSGRHMVSVGNYVAELLQISQHGKNCKMLFDIDNRGVYLYFTISKDLLTIEQIIDFGNSIGRQFDVTVQHEIIPATGDYHAVISSVFKPK